MSPSGDSGARRAPEALARLDTAVEGVLSRNRDLRERLEAAEARARDLDGVLRRISEGEIDPGEILGRMRLLEEENRALRERLERGRDGVERLLARIRFLEEQR